MDTSPGTLGEFLWNFLEAEIKEEGGEEYSEYAFLWLQEFPKCPDYRSNYMVQLHAARQILKVMEESELRIKVHTRGRLEERVAEREFSAVESISEQVSRAKRSVLRRVDFHTEVGVVIGEVFIEFPRKYWKLAATKEPRS